VRVAEALAGPNWGSQFTPRIGTEVLVDFIEHDMDRPLVVAQLYNGADAPPYAAGVDSDVNHAGTISGIHTNSFDGGGFNQWQLDDTQGQVRMRLATSMANTQLNLGYLVQQSAGSAQRGKYRGTGFELRTDAWAVLRGGAGVLLTTRVRGGHASGVTSTQMDAAEAVAALGAAQKLDDTLLAAAKGQHALSSAASVAARKEFVSQIDPQQQGKIDGAFKPQPGQRAPDSSAPVEKFSAPIVLMDAQAGINWASQGSTVLFAGEQLHWTTQSDLHMSAAATMSSVAARTAGLFTHDGGIQVFAGNGPVSLQAHTDKLEILADKEVKILSVNDKVEVNAKQKIVLQAGQSSVTLDGGNITFACPGKFTVKSGQHAFDAGARGSATIPELPSGTVVAPRLEPASLLPVQPDKFSERLVVFNPVTGEKLSTGYALIEGNSMVDKGRTGGDGYAARKLKDKPATLYALVGPSAAWTVEYHSGQDGLPPIQHNVDEPHSSEVGS
jgi:type VI secretion system secreted protein VgrG